MASTWGKKRGRITAGMWCICTQWVLRSCLKMDAHSIICNLFSVWRIPARLLPHAVKQARAPWTRRPNRLMGNRTIVLQICSKNLKIPLYLPVERKKGEETFGVLENFLQFCSFKSRCGLNGEWNNRTFSWIPRAMLPVWLPTWVHKFYTHPPLPYLLTIK